MALQSETRVELRLCLYFEVIVVALQSETRVKLEPIHTEKY